MDTIGTHLFQNIYRETDRDIQRDKEEQIVTETARATLRETVPGISIDDSANGNHRYSCRLMPGHWSAKRSLKVKIKYIFCQVNKKNQCELKNNAKKLQQI